LHVRTWAGETNWDSAGGSRTDPERLDDDKSKTAAKAAAVAAATAPAPDTALHADHLLFNIWSKA
jgi:hypothetical protein